MLKIFSKIYFLITFIRNKCYDFKLFKEYKVNLPIICVGNITIGGNSKTPFVIHLIKLLKTLNYTPVVLTRGYKSKIKNTPYLIKDIDNATHIGDEPSLIKLKANIPIVISPDRVKGARYILAHKLGDIIIMDDGFQHRRLKKDINFVLVDSSSNESISRMFNGNLLPLGKLRESIKDGLKRTDCIVFSSNSEKTTLPLLDIPSITLKNKYIFLDYLLNSIPVPKSGVLLSGIANPDRFVNAIKQFNIKIEDSILLKDHFKYNKKFISNILYKNTLIITTFKDFVKLMDLDLELSKFVILDLDLEVNDQYLTNFIKNKIKG